MCRLMSLVSATQVKDIRRACHRRPLTWFFGRAIGDRAMPPNPTVSSDPFVRPWSDDLILDRGPRARRQRPLHGYDPAPGRSVESQLPGVCPGVFGSHDHQVLHLGGVGVTLHGYRQPVGLIAVRRSGFAGPAIGTGVRAERGDAMAAQPRVRKNIDRFTPQELGDYEHAISKLLEISTSDPQSIDGYTYFEQLHDGELGPCEYKNDTFMPWHRAHLFLFEEALRRSDPPRTATVTVPYWDWSALPSGTRYPTAFENQNSVLFHEFRSETPICRIPARAAATACRSPGPSSTPEF
jgi:hypothetical protein